MGAKPSCSKKKTQIIKIERPKIDRDFSRIKTVCAEEIMKKSVWFIEKEEVDNYFSQEELTYYKKMNLSSKKFSDMLIPIKPEKIRFFLVFL